MITPKFKLDQDGDHLYINIRVPYANLNEVEVCVDKNDFRFYCKPYYLRLNLPGEIKEESESSKYDVDENTFKFKYQKTTPGQNFEGLDLLTKLLTPANGAKKNATPLIEEVSTNGEEVPVQQEEDDDDDGDQWFIEQKCESQQENEEISLTDCVSKYGFALTKSNVFSKLSDEYLTVIDLPNPDDYESSRVEKRAQMRTEQEDQKFDEEHYLADFFDDTEMIGDTLLKYKPAYFKIGTDEEDVVLDYTDKEIDVLKALPRRTYLLDKSQKLSAYLGLVDILYAYCYNNRINCGEKNVESGWTIAKLSSTLSWFDSFKSLEDCVLASFRRSLCFPLYRNWDLSKAAFKDLKKMFWIGRKLILKSLLEIRESFLDGDCRYIFNDLYITDYCVWIQQASEKKLSELAQSLSKIKIHKKTLGFDLEELEMAGELALKEHEENQSDEDDDDESESSEDETSSENEEKEAKKGDLAAVSKTDAKAKSTVESPDQVEKDLVINLQTLRLNSKDEVTNASRPKIVELN